MKPTEITKAIRRRLVSLASTRAKADQSDIKIKDATQKELARVNADIEKLRLRAHMEDDAADRYQSLILDRERLQAILR